jgi:diketogulonate reductase-like aldo/keto reductase
MTETPSVTLPSGATMPAFGLGTWRMGNERSRRKQETDAIAHAIDIGYPMIDTAEMYGEGVAEEAIADALVGRKRDAIYLVSKVYPHNASKLGTVAACERSLKRLKTDRIDLYLLHWPGSTPADETIGAFGRLVAEGKIRRWGISNFDAKGTARWHARPGGAALAGNQVLYNLGVRGIEFDLLPWCRTHGVPLMAYTPLGQGRLARDKAIQSVARRRGVAPLQVALAWTLRGEGVISIPKAGRREHLRENRAAADLALAPEDLAELDRAFPPPSRAEPLGML